MSALMLTDRLAILSAILRILTNERLLVTRDQRDRINFYHDRITE